MKILAIETSCDETAAAVVQDGLKILSSSVSTQIPFHQPYKGVVPELASRAHVITLNRVVADALKKARLSLDSSKKSARPDAIAVTVGPGLVGALLVGRMAAEAFGWANQIPVYGMNHIEGHLLSPVLADNDVKPPFLGLVASGGHTELILAKKWGDYALFGRTLDDAAGEAFDKVAKMMDLGYPGGPVIDRLAEKGDPSRFPFPRPWLPGTWNFSFSGLKTSMLYRLREKSRWTARDKRDLCASFREAVVDVLTRKTVAAAQLLKVNTIAVGGGVAANLLLRRRFAELCRPLGIRLSIPPIHLCTDNAAMVASAAFYAIRRGDRPAALKVTPQMQIPLLKRKLPGFRPQS